MAAAQLMAPTFIPIPHGCCSHPAVVKGALQLDRAAIALDSRPQLRAALMAYFVLLHALALLF